MQKTINFTVKSCQTQYMKESYIHAGNATIKQVQRDILMNIKGQFMKGLNTLVYSAENN